MIKQKAIRRLEGYVYAECPWDGLCCFPQRGRGPIICRCGYCMDVVESDEHGLTVHCVYDESHEVKV